MLSLISINPSKKLGLRLAPQSGRILTAYGGQEVELRQGLDAPILKVQGVDLPLKLWTSSHSIMQDVLLGMDWCTMYQVSLDTPALSATLGAVLG